MPKLLDAYKTMTLYNERNLNNVNGGSKIYTDEMFDEFRNGTRRETDWNNLIFAKTSPQTNHNITVSGGNDKTQYFVSFGAFYQEGFFKSGDLNYHKYNITSNLTTEVYRGLKLMRRAPCSIMMALTLKRIRWLK